MSVFSPPRCRARRGVFILPLTEGQVDRQGRRHRAAAPRAQRRIPGIASLPDYNRPTLPAATAAAMLASPKRLGCASLGVSGGAHPEVAQAEEEPSEPAVVPGSGIMTGEPEASPPMGGDVGRWLRVFWMGTDGNEVAGLATVVQEAQHGHEKSALARSCPCHAATCRPPEAPPAGSGRAFGPGKSALTTGCRRKGCSVVCALAPAQSRQRLWCCASRRLGGWPTCASKRAARTGQLT